MKVHDQDKSNCDLAYMASFWRENQLVWTTKKQEEELNEKLIVWGTKVEAMVQGCPFLCFVAFFIIFFYPCWNYVRIKDMLWIGDIVESTPSPPFFTNFTSNMVGFVNPPHKVVARRNVISTFSTAQNAGELESGAKSEKLNCECCIPLHSSYSNVVQ